MVREAARAKLFGSMRARPVQLGRYRLLRRLGRGGMGEVMLAHDPELDRNVAIKLLGSGVTGDGQARGRLAREARALARLDHPNVVPIHDAGVVGEQVWLAMEFIDGGTLRAWLAAHRRTRAAVLEVLRAAGRGLAAA
ncbi:MAG: protein kinase, partial [Nannocystaceae bacterium]|nr:protein kinase [Nannocystaceae bacterium]